MRDEIIEGLRHALYRLSWVGLFWGKDGAIAVAKTMARHLEKLDKKEDAFSVLSAIFYSAGGNAKARALRSFWASLFWFIVAFYCRKRARRFSEKMVGAGGGIENLSPRRLEIRACILRVNGNYEEAEDCISKALFRPRMSDNTRALLMMGKAELQTRVGLLVEAECNYREALELPLAEIARSRILRSFGVFLRMKGDEKEAVQVFEQAKKIASGYGLEDQADKLEAVI